MSRQAAAGCSAFVRPALHCRRRSLALRVASIAAPMAPPAAPLVERDLPAIDEVRVHASVGAGTPARPAFSSLGSRSRSPGTLAAAGSWRVPGHSTMHASATLLAEALYQPVAVKSCEGLHSCFAGACVA